MESLATWVPVIAASIAIIVSLIAWRTTRSLHFLKSQFDLEVQTRIAQIESYLKQNSTEIEGLSKKIDADTALVTKAIQDIQHFKNFLRRLTAVLIAGENTESHSMLDQLNPAVAKVEAAHSSISSHFQHEYDTTTLHAFKNRVIRQQPIMAAILSPTKADNTRKEEKVRSISDLYPFADDAQNMLRDLLKQHRTTIQLEIERARHSSLG